MHIHKIIFPTALSNLIQKANLVNVERKGGVSLRNNLD